MNLIEDTVKHYKMLLLILLTSLLCVYYLSIYIYIYMRVSEHTEITAGTRNE